MTAGLLGVALATYSLKVRSNLRSPLRLPLDLVNHLAVVRRPASEWSSSHEGVREAHSRVCLSRIRAKRISLCAALQGSSGEPNVQSGGTHRRGAAAAAMRRTGLTRPLGTYADPLLDMALHFDRGPCSNLGGRQWVEVFLRQPLDGGHGDRIAKGK